MTNNSSFEFFSAITRCPAASIVDGLRAKDTGAPDLKQMLADHAHYVATLNRTGAEVIELPLLEESLTACLSRTQRFACRRARY